MTKKYGTLTCKKCGKKYRYKVSPKYVDRDPNRLIATRRHYAKHHPEAIKRWHKGIKHVDAKHPKKSSSKKGKKPTGEGWKWNKKVKRWVRRKKKGRGFEFK